jgi:hypothetical protein
MMDVSNQGFSNQICFGCQVTSLPLGLLLILEHGASAK